VGATWRSVRGVNFLGSERLSDRAGCGSHFHTHGLGAHVTMRFLKFKLPVWVAGGLLTSVAATATAAEPNVAGQFDPDLYRQVAQADVPSVAVPVPAAPTLVPEDLYERRALPAAEAAEEAANEPNRYLQSRFLEERGIATYGWVDVGIGANNWGAPWNGPITFNDRAWQGMMNQLYLVNERTLGEDLDWGGRIDLLYGTDYIYTVAQGLDAFRSNPDPLGLSGPRWGSSRYYGLAMPQLYGELGREDLGVKFGHFYTLIGYEVVPAIGNFFYTHAYTMQYGEPFTHTGILGNWTPNDQLNIVAGITNGWDNWDNGLLTGGPIANTNYPGYNNNAAFLGAITFTSSDEKQALILANSSGNELGGVDALGGQLVGNRTVTSIVYTNELSDRLNYVYQSDIGYQFNAAPDYQTIGQQDGTAYWYGVNQYMFYNFTDTLIGGLRLEWFRDNNGTRVLYGIRDGSPGLGGFAGNFWAMTWGLNYLMGSNFVIRPELRYDWFTPDAGGQIANGGILPYGVNADKYGQFYGGCDIIWQF
jgi:hypothetical protein